MSSEDVSAMTERQLRARLLETPGTADEGLMAACLEDRRAGVRKLVETRRRRDAAAERERARLEGILRIERQWVDRGFSAVAGVDEVGRGPLAGPVVAACVVLAFDAPIPGVNDSKQVARQRREALAGEIRSRASGVGIGQADVSEIDRFNILEASRLAMTRAVAACGPGRPDVLLVDAMRLPEVELAQQSVVHGDERSYCIAAASIVAKVHRDRLMIELDATYPEYGFASHKGYGTAEHMAALERHGPCELHRRSFAPVQGYSLPSCELFLEEIRRATSLERLRATGIRIRELGVHLTPRELDDLRQAYRDRLDGL